MFMVKDFWAVPEYAELLTADQQAHLSLHRRRRGHGQGSARRARGRLERDVQEVRPRDSSNASTGAGGGTSSSSGSRVSKRSREERFGDTIDDHARSGVARGGARMERPHDPQPLHHSDDRLPDRLQHLSADLFARLFVHRLPRLDERAGQLRRPAELSRAARPTRFIWTNFSITAKYVIVSVAGQMIVGFGLALLLNRAIPLQGPDHDAAAPADDAVGGRGRAVLEAALRSVLGHHQLRARPRQLRLAVGSEAGALRGRDHRHLDVVAVRDAAVARRPVGGAAASLRGGGDRPRRRLVHLLPHHAAAGRADPADRDHLPHHGGVQDLRPRLHHDRPSRRPS